MAKIRNIDSSITPIGSADCTPCESVKFRVNKNPTTSAIASTKQGSQCKVHILIPRPTIKFLNDMFINMKIRPQDPSCVASHWHMMCSARKFPYPRYDAESQWTRSVPKVRKIGIHKSIIPPRPELNYTTISRFWVRRLEFQVGLRCFFVQEQLTGSWSIKITNLVYNIPMKKNISKLINESRKTSGSPLQMNESWFGDSTQVCDLNRISGAADMGIPNWTCYFGTYSGRSPWS
jgi:hypothetical protein